MVQNNSIRRKMSDTCSAPGGNAMTGTSQAQTGCVLRVTIDDRIAHLVFNRPAKRNAINDATLQALDAFFSAVPKVVPVIVLSVRAGIFRPARSVRAKRARDAGNSASFARLARDHGQDPTVGRARRFRSDRRGDGRWTGDRRRANLISAGRRPGRCRPFRNCPSRENLHGGCRPSRGSRPAR